MSSMRQAHISVLWCYIPIFIVLVSSIWVFRENDSVCVVMSFFSNLQKRIFDVIHAPDSTLNVVVLYHRFLTAL